MAWNQLVGGGHPRGTLADMANKYPEELALEQNRNIGLGAVKPLADIMRPTVDAAKYLYGLLPDSSTTQVRKMREKMTPALQEGHPGVNAALNPSPALLVPPNLPKNDAEFMRRIYQQPAVSNAAQTQPALLDNQNTPPQSAPTDKSTPVPSAIGVSDFSLVANPLDNPQAASFSKNDIEKQGIAYDPNKQGDALSKAIAANPASTGRELIDVAAGGGQPYAPMFAGQSRQVGMAQAGGNTPFEPSQGGRTPMPANDPSKPMYQPLMEGGVATNVQRGGSALPIYETSYYDAEGKTIATITGKNQRVGGGTLSFVGGRTPEEQAAIDQRVASIDSQTAAMRGLRNANRLDQGGVTVEQEQRMNDISAMMNRFAPNSGDIDAKMAAAMQGYQSASNMKSSPGNVVTAKMREAAQEPYKAQLAILQAEKANADRARQEILSGAMGSQAAQDQAQRESAINQNTATAAQRKALQDQANLDRQFGFDALKAGADDYVARQRLSLDAGKEGKEKDMVSKFASDTYQQYIDAGKEADFINEKFKPFPDKDKPIPMAPYAKNGRVVIVDEKGNEHDVHPTIAFDYLIRSQKASLER